MISDSLNVTVNNTRSHHNLLDRNRLQPMLQACANFLHSILFKFEIRSMTLNFQKHLPSKSFDVISSFIAVWTQNASRHVLGAMSVFGTTHVLHFFSSAKSIEKFSSVFWQPDLGTYVGHPSRSQALQWDDPSCSSRAWK